jgi:trans-2-enoyl-CoA reductase
MEINVRQSSAVVLERFGPPDEVARLGRVPFPTLEPGWVLVEVEAAPINPADVNVLEGKYGELPRLPAVPGSEGVGRVRELGAGVGEEWLGKRVLLPPKFGSWRHWGSAPVSSLRVVPMGVAVRQAAMLRINPPTAYGLLHLFTVLRPGDWIVQNAGNSGVGRAVIQIAKARGWRCVSIVRRPELVTELQALGSDVALLEGDQLSERIREATGGEAPRLGLNAVGGESALGVAGSLAEGSPLVTYGAMGKQPLRLPNSFLIFRDLRFHGFWVSRWFERASAQELDRMFEELFEWSVTGLLWAPVEAEYPLSSIREAVVHAMRSGRSGKVLLRPEHGEE